jgi:hypothetical protein
LARLACHGARASARGATGLAALTALVEGRAAAGHDQRRRRHETEQESLTQLHAEASLWVEDETIVNNASS